MSHLRTETSWRRLHDCLILSENRPHTLSSVNTPHTPCQQASEWEAKFVGLKERHTTARGEFEKLKQVAKERKAAAAELQKQVGLVHAVFGYIL